MDRQLMHLLREATMATRAAFRNALVDLDLTPVQNTALHLVETTPGTSSAELARRMHVTPQTMHKLVTELQHRGLLALQPRPGHGRILEIHLTDQGQQLLTEADTRAQVVEDRMTAGLDQRHRQQLVQLLQHCITALDMPCDDHHRAGDGTG
jgi:DNA-binding MarR family transcriptional regulator